MTTITRAKITSNPDRPTPAGYCANCGSTGSCKKWRGSEGGCVMEPRPITLESHEKDERDAAINVMTSARRAEVLQLLARLVPEKFDFAAAYERSW